MNYCTVISNYGDLYKSCLLKISLPVTIIEFCENLKMDYVKDVRQNK